MTTTPDLTAVLKTAVQTSVADIQSVYGEDRVRIVPDQQGGAWVEVAAVPLGDPYLQEDSFIVFLVPFNLPGADIYPLFVRPDLTRRDGAGLGEGLAATNLTWPGDPQPRPVVQVSRRTRRGAFAAQTAVQKIEKVLEWLRSR